MAAPAPTAPEPPRPSPPARWLRPGWPLYILLALGFGAYLGFNQIIGLRGAGSTIAGWKPLWWETSSVLVTMLLIPAIVALDRRAPLGTGVRGRTLALHALAALAFSIVHTTGMVLLRKLAYALAGQNYDFGNPFRAGFYELQKDVITYALVQLVIFAVREFRVRRAGELRAAQLAAELSEARLRHLTAQIEPHFLFNTLNAISNRMHEDVEAADRMISSLAGLLRAAYDGDRQVLVPLDRELEWLRGYTAMMGERFRGQLAFELDVEAGVELIHVPRLLLQPLVENALTHGLRDGRGWLKVDVRRQGAALRYEIDDDGVGLTGAGAVRGTGLSNVARRLELLFPGQHSLSLEPRQPRGTTVVVTFPVRA